jgi:haloalkane dehalogenase
MKVILVILFIVALLLVIGVILQRDGAQTTPSGKGTVTLSAGNFEAFPLPEYAAKHAGPDYKSYLVEVEPGIKVHVMEVGEGYPVYLQHGNPTSGFLYRKIVSELANDNLRLIMPTLVGLGFSSKVPASQHTADNHTRWINSVLTQLDLREVVFVGQDWGGAIGMGALALSPGMVKGAVIMNTLLDAPTEKKDVSSIHARVKTPVLGELIIEIIGKQVGSLGAMQGDPESIPEEIDELYKRPQIDDGNYKATLAMMRMVPDGPDHPTAKSMGFVEQYVDQLNISVEIVWGMSDPILGGRLPDMIENFPEARVTKTNAGHFLQEEVPGDIAGAVRRVVAKTQ